MVLPVIGWAASTEAGSLVATAVAVGIATFATTMFRTLELRMASLTVAVASTMLAVALVLASRDATLGVTGLGVSITAAVLLVAARALRPSRPSSPTTIALEGLALAGFGLGISLAGTDARWGAVGLAIGVAALAVSAHVRDERGTVYAAAALIGAAITIPAVVDVAGGEWISLPAAVACLAASRIRGAAREQSFLSLGPGLVLGLGPSVALATTQAGALRPALVAVSCAIVLAIGVWTRQAAPIAIAAAGLLALGLDLIAPIATEAPRWLVIGTLGVITLWAGATADRRLDQLRRFRTTIDKLG